MPRALIALLISLLVCGVVLAADSHVELAYRLQPERDITMDTTIEGITTLRVVEDRGIVAKSSGRMSMLPTTIKLTRRQTFQYITGSSAEDGSFPAELRVLEQTTSVQSSDGKEQIIPERTSLKGLTVMAVIERAGSLRPDSIDLRGVDAALSEQLRPTLVSVLAQAASMPSIHLTPSQAVTQEMQMQVPIAGIASIDLKMKISNRLLSVEDGLARIQQVYTMDFGSAPSGTKIAADGSGGGSMLYDTRSKTVLFNDTSTIMKMTVEAADGTVEMKMNSKQVQKVRAAATPLR